LERNLKENIDAFFCRIIPLSASFLQSYEIFLPALFVFAQFIPGDLYSVIPSNFKAKPR